MNRLLIAAALAGSVAAAGLSACGTSAVVCDWPTDTACGNNMCVNLKTDPNHCGACNNTCATGQSCGVPDGGSESACLCPNGTSPADGGICAFEK
jgi:hypothetical protein